jgi:hypothetical protein
MTFDSVLEDNGRGVGGRRIPLVVAPALGVMRVIEQAHLGSEFSGSG